MGLASDLQSLGLSLLAGVGPIALLLWLLNRRDRRARALHGLIVDQFSGEALRSEVVVAVQGGLLAPDRVRVDLRGAPHMPLWETATRLRRVLPARVQLTVEGSTDGAVRFAAPVRVTLESLATPLGRAA